MLMVQEEVAEVVESSLSITPLMNPFSDCLEVAVSGTFGQLSVSVYDLQGRRVAELHPNGQGNYIWDGRDSSGEIIPVDAYVVRAEQGFLSSSIFVVKLQKRNILRT